MLREFDVKKEYSDLDIDVEILKSNFSQLDQNISQNDLTVRLTQVDAAFFNRSNNQKWGNKAVSGFLNDLFNTNVFVY